MVKRIRLCGFAEVRDLLPEALAGKFVLAPVGDQDSADLIDVLAPVSEPDAAVIVMTSGSTGAARQVVLSSHAIIASADAFRQRYGSFRWFSELAPNHVGGLMVHARHVLDQRHAAGRQAISIVPTQLVRILRSPELTSQFRAYDAVLVGGAPAGSEILERSQRAGIRVLTSYGMSETCGGVVFDGIPLTGVDVALGDAGRISITGDVVFSGYRFQPEETAEVLSGQCFLTNDRGEWVTDGDGRRKLRIVGRIDDVIISGGVNVDLAEVQRVLRSHFDECAVVVAVPDPEWGARVVLVSTSQERSLDRWREGLRQYLEPAGLPRQLLVVQEIPQTSSGKIDRQRLVSWATDQGA